METIVELAWRRWYKRAIAKSVDQIRGAERWIKQFPERIYLDRKCTQKLPLPLPPIERRKVHGIVVALGAGKACQKFFGEGIGSLMISPQIQGDQHWRPEHVSPFSIGDVDPSGSFVHVLDDATLDIVMGELDTITDFTAYLSKKERLIRSGSLMVAGGEEDLLAYYMTHMNEDGEHDFTAPDGKKLKEKQFIGFATGFYTELTANPQYIAKKKADEISYLWDRLIEAFTTHMLAGTTIVPDGRQFVLSDHEEGIRHMAIVPRHMRRMMGEALYGALEKGRTTDRFTRAFVPGPSEANQDTGFFFMTLAKPKFEITGGYEQYRAVRRNMLQTYALALLQRHQQLKQIVGIATEPPSDTTSGSSEDLVVAHAPEWTPDLVKDLEERKKAYDITRPGNFSEYRVHGNEFPEVQRRQRTNKALGLNRHARRARAAMTRKKRK